LYKGLELNEYLVKAKVGGKAAPAHTTLLCVHAAWVTLEFGLTPVRVGVKKLRVGVRVRISIYLCLSIYPSLIYQLIYTSSLSCEATWAL